LIANLARNSGGFQVALNDTDFGAVRGGKDVPHQGTSDFVEGSQSEMPLSQSLHECRSLEILYAASGLRSGREVCGVRTFASQ
jgi:hypothetical protein